MAAFRRKKFALLILMAVMMSAIVMTSFYSDSGEMTILNGEQPLLISVTPLDNHVAQSEKVDEESFTSIYDRLEHRKKVLKRECAAHKNDKPPSYHSLYVNQPNLHLMISKNKQLMYCYLPKVANTNFRRIFLGLEGHVELDKMEAVSGYDVYFTLDNKFKYLNNFPTNEQSEMLKTYKKFIVVREPLERLLSGYRNKFFHPNQKHRDEYHTRVKQFYFKHKYLKEQHKIDTNFKDRSITFSEFLIYWIDLFETKQFVNEHFVPNSELCSPCNYDFDYIIRYEKLEEETNFMFNELNFGIKFPARNDNYSSVATSTLVDDYYKPVESWILKKVWTILHTDFNSFSYQLPKWYSDKIKV